MNNLKIIKGIYNVKLIKDFMKEKALTKTEFCKGCGMDIGTLDRVFYYHTTLRVLAFIKMSEFMQVPLEEFFKREEE